MKYGRATIYLTAAAIIMFVQSGLARGEAAKGEVKGSAYVHTDQSRLAAVAQASVALPARVTNGPVFFGAWKDIPPLTNPPRVPVVIFLHGSSGLSLNAIGEWQQWLAGLGIASVAPDSFALPDRITYTSPVSREIYERIHALRASEIELALAAVQAAPFADASRLVLAGTSEGSPAVARHGGREFAARIFYAWSCEDNYFVEAHRTAIVAGQPVLNIISASDPFFSARNSYLGNTAAQGHCGGALADSKQATVVLIPGAPHTLINLPQARAATRSFLQDTLKLP
ncbi:MAG: hypothetical protein U1E61_13365 [Bradyrhizobium sp.]